MRILVCGGRDYADQRKINETLDQFQTDGLTIIEGGARGADLGAHNWAFCKGVDMVTYPADWKKYGKRAGYIRNVQMLNEGKPDLVIAFPGGKGTAMMVRLARAAGVPVIEVKA